MPDTHKNVPDLYSLLKLQPLEADSKKILKALSRLKKHIQTSQESGDKSKAQKGLRLLKLAKQNLLDAERKKAFDQKWQAAFGTNPKSEPEKCWNYDSLTPMLPTGDPNAEFDMASFLASSPESTQSQLDAEFARLISLLDDEDSDDAIEPLQPATQVVAAVPVKAGSRIEHASPQETLPPAQLAKKLRRKRARSTILLALGGTVSLVATIGLILFVLQQNKPADRENGQNAPQANAGEDAPRNRITAPQGSGLPKVGVGNDTNAVPNTDTPSDSPDNQPNIPDVQPPATEPSPPVMQEPTPPPRVELTEEEKTQWKQQTNRVAGMLSKQDYAAAAEALAKLSEYAKTEDQKSQAYRLGLAATLAEEFQSSIIEAIMEFEAGESFVVGSQTEISFVSGDSQEVTLKIFGRNQTYRLDDLRMGIAQALAKFKLDLDHPNSKAMQAAFMRFHPAVRDMEVAKELMQEAVRAGVIQPGILGLFDDEYEL